ncbi:MAG: endonuclease/exonuclease/phosphatase family protein, partial [Hyphomicrobiales bacterium]|nr:endonuclease/exonuclease/phosphatase family protein [Hyphomicrobiales bacterium]
MRIATWNVNSVRQRISHLLAYLKEASPDALCLQEIKCLDEQFPRLEVEDLGYNVETHGQKGFNGVAILAKRPSDVARGLPGDDADVQSRCIEAVIPTETGVVRLASVYLPNGNPPNSDKYPHKLVIMDQLVRHATKLLLGIALPWTGAPAMAASLPPPIAGQNYVMTFSDTFTAPDWDQDPATKGTIRWWNFLDCGCMNVTGGDTAGVQVYPETVGVDPYSIGVNGTKSGLNDKLIKKNNTWVTGALGSTDQTGTKGFMQSYGYFEASIKF